MSYSLQNWIKKYLPSSDEVTTKRQSADVAIIGIACRVFRRLMITINFGITLSTV